MSRAFRTTAPSSEQTLGPALEVPDVRDRLERERARISLKTMLFGGADTGPMRLGRYEIVETIGRGGMGIVYRARDPHLRRDVAIKVLHAHRTSEVDRRRLRREAQALAALTHPNVVSVFEVAEDGDELYVVMELVPGETLRQWQEQRHRVPDVLAMYRQAGLGLAAAHRMGLVHRDFKPDNVLIGREGRPRVVDFGLARAEESIERLFDTNRFPSSGSVSLERSITATGALVGTPAYMSPEQFEGGELTPASDQFSFCVALWEALCGHRPFQGDSYLGLADAVLNGRVEAPPTQVMPRSVRRVLLRGLSKVPFERWPSMDALLTALQPHPWGLRRVGAAAGIASAAALGAVLYDPPPDLGACDDLAPRIESIWSPEAAARLRTAFEGTRLPYATATATRVTGDLDHYAKRWVAARTEICRNPSQTASSDAQLQCLGRARTALRALLDGLAVVDATSLEAVVGAVASLPDPARCSEDGHTDGESWIDVPGDARVALRVEQLRSDIDRASVLDHLGKFDEGLQILADATAAADVIGFPQLQAEAWTALGELQFHAHQADEAAHSLARAFHLAQTAGDDDLATDASTFLAEVLVTQLARYDEAEQWIRHARAVHRRTGGQRRLAQLRYLEGRLALEVGDYAKARSALEETLALAEQRKAEEASVGPAARFALAHVQLQLGEFDTAKATFTALHADEIERYGEDHPRVARTHQSLGAVAFRQGDLDQALEHMQRNLEISRAAYGDAHLEVASGLNNVGSMLGHLGRFEEAREYFERSLELRRDLLAPDHPDLLVASSNLGQLEHKLGNHAQAERLLLQTLMGHERVFGDGHEEVAMDLINLGEVAIYQNHPQVALERNLRAAAILEAIDPAHPELPNALNGAGVAYLELERTDEALAVQTRAVTISEQVFGEDNPRTVMMAVNVASAELDAGRAEDAKQRLDALLPRLDAVVGADHPDLAFPLILSVRIELALGQPRQAVAPAERALKLRTDNRVDPVLLAEAQYYLGEALWGARKDRGRARSLVAESAELWAAAGEAEAQNYAMASAWLRSHPPK